MNDSLTEETHIPHPGDRYTLLNLNSVSFLISEFIPYGVSNLYQLNNSFLSNINAETALFNCHETCPRLTNNAFTISPSYIGKILN